jgi:predicted dehydrogenase
VHRYADHRHAIIARSALSHGQGVSREKPLTHNIHEAGTLLETTRWHNRILQTGSIQRGRGEFRIT